MSKETHESHCAFSFRKEDSNEFLLLLVRPLLLVAMHLLQESGFLKSDFKLNIWSFRGQWAGAKPKSRPNGKRRRISNSVELLNIFFFSIPSRFSVDRYQSVATALLVLGGTG